ncbi:MAG: hypothetical protein HQL99_01235 [Magnetococcales bacterium]|nr:hypothetical protein [Magnetococcales bacterium]
MKRLVKTTALILAMALLSVVASLQTIVSSEPFRRQLIETLSRNVPGEVELATLNLDFATGLQATDLQWRLNGQPLLRLAHATLDIHWRDLWQGQLTIREVRLSGGHLNASADAWAAFAPPPDTSASPPPPVQPPTPGVTPALLTAPLPLRLEMQALILEKIDLDYAPSTTQRLTFKNLTARAALRANRQEIDLKGRVTLDELAYADSHGALRFPLSLELDLGNPEHGTSGARRSALRLGEWLHVPLDLRLALDRQPAEIELAIQADPVQLAPLLALARPWLPAAWQSSGLTGQATPELSFKGAWHDDGLSGHAQGAVNLTGLTFTPPPDTPLTLASSQARFRLLDLEWQANALKTLTTEWSLTAEALTTPWGRVEALSGLLVADHRPDGSLAGHARVKTPRVWLGAGETDPDTNLPFAFETMLLASGNPRQERFTLERVVVKLGDFARLGGRLTMTPDPKQPPGSRHLVGALQAELEGTRLALPSARHLPPGVSLSVAPGSSRFTVKADATLDDPHTIRHITLEGSTRLTPFAWSMAENGPGAGLQAAHLTWKATRPNPDGPVEGRLDGTIRVDALNLGDGLTSGPGSLKINASGAYHPQTGAVTGQLGLNPNLTRLTAGPNLAIEHWHATLDAHLRGSTPLKPEEPVKPEEPEEPVKPGELVKLVKPVKPEELVKPGEPKKPEKPVKSGAAGLTVQQEWHGQGGGITLQHDTDTWSLPTATFEARLVSDLNAGSHQLEAMQLTLSRLLTARLSGHYRASDDQFQLTGALERLELGRPGEGVTRNGDPWPGADTPHRGTLEAKLDASGTLEAVSRWNGDGPPPARLDLQLQAADLNGIWGGQKVTGGQGNARLRMGTDPDRSTRLSAELKAGRWEWSETLLPNGVNQPRLELELSGSAQDHWVVQRLRGAIPGLEAELNGKISGLFRLLRDQTHPVASLAALFADLDGKARWDLAEEKQLLASLETQGTGKTELELKLLKPVHGPITAHATLAPHAVSVRREGFALKGLQGRMSGDKTTWLTQAAVPAKPRGGRAFSLERLASPLTSGMEGRRLRIDSLELGGVRAEQIAMDVSFQDGTIRGQNLEMALLGGTIGGTVLLEGSKPARMDALLEGVAVDLNRLLPPGEGVAGDGAVNFVSRLAIRFDRERGKLNLGRTEISILFTRIGKEALDRLLLFLDPKESNPAIVNARSKLSYANPSGLDLQLSRGTIKLKIDFREGVVSTLNIDRIPLGVLGRFEQIQTHLLPVENLARLLEWLGVAHLESETRESSPPSP